MKLFGETINAKELIEKINNAPAEKKSEVIVEVIEKVNEMANKELIAQLQAENEELIAGRQTAERLGLRALNADEKAFYEKLKNPNQAVTFTQGDIIPTNIIDNTLANVREASDTLALVNFAPAGVQRWIVASKTGKAAWGALDARLTAELTASFSSLDIEVNKLHVMLVVPKAVRDLGLPFVDKYFSAILAEAMHDGLVDGYLNGKGGKSGPIGITKKIETYESNGENSDKAPVTITGFSPEELADVKKTLSNDGKRKLGTLHIVANPNDVYKYIDPALYLMNAMGIYVKASKDDIEVHEEPGINAGTAVMTIDGAYTMGINSVRVDEYKEIKAVEDCDLFIAKAAANGRAVDDNTAVVFDPANLVPAKLPVAQPAETKE